jgi:hypothetical protein
VCVCSDKSRRVAAGLEELRTANPRAGLFPEIPLRQASGELLKLCDLGLVSGPSHDVPGPRTHDMRLVRWQSKLLSQLPGDRGKSISIEIAERSQTMAVAAKIHGLIEPQNLGMSLLPELARRLVAVAGGPVERSLGLTKGGVNRNDHLPGERLKPWSFHRVS